MDTVDEQNTYFIQELYVDLMLEPVSSDFCEFESRSRSVQGRKPKAHHSSSAYGQDCEGSLLQLSESYRKETTKTGKSRKESVRNSTAKYREKKKQQLQHLESCVRALEMEVEQVDQELEKIRQKKMEALEEKAKANHVMSEHENAEIYSEMEEMICRKSKQQSPDKPVLEVDIDKINLLMDTLKYRIGASGRERQAKINFQFKNIVNTLFPALYRYILICAFKEIDLFSLTETKMNWTQKLIQDLNLKPEQVDRLKEHQVELVNFFSEIRQGIQHLQAIKEKLKVEALQVEKVEETYRQILEPIQCAQWTLFSQRHKSKPVIALNYDLAQSRRQDGHIPGSLPTKRVKKQQQY